MANKKRYFIFSASFENARAALVIQSYGISFDEFPTMSNLKDVVKRCYESANSISILSVCEVKKADFDKFFSEKD